MNETEIVNKIFSDLKMGWWSADSAQRFFRFSDYLKNTFGLPSNEISFDQFQQRIAPAYRQQIVRSMEAYDSQFAYDEIFPILCPQGEVSFRWKILHKESTGDNGSCILSGYAQIDASEEKHTSAEDVQRMNNLLYQLTSISHSLLSFLHTEQVDEVVNKILFDVLQMFKGSRAYITEFDWERKKHFCSYEVTADGVSKEREYLNELSLDDTPWWVDRLGNGSPIILSSLDDLPPEASREQDILSVQHIKSLIVMPLMFRDKVWGYAGIDLVDHSRRWTNEDCQWFASLVNIIGLCIQLRRSEREASEDRAYLRNLYSYMPLGYMRIKIKHDSNNQPIDYMVVDSNDATNKIMELKREDYVGQWASEMNTINYKVKLQTLSQVLRTQQPIEKKNVLEHVEKTLHTIIYTAVPEEVICLVSDRTEVDRAQQALDHSEKLLRNIFDTIPVGIELYDKDGVLLELNNKDTEIFGVHHKDEVQGKINFFDNPNVPAIYHQSVREKKECSFKLVYPFDQLGDYYETSKTGYLEIYTSVSMLYDCKGDFTGFMLINIDNTEINRAHSRIAEFERTFELVSRYGCIGYCRYDLLSREGYASSQWFRNIGETEDTPLPQIIGTYSHMHPSYRKEFLDNIQQIQEGSINSFSRDVCILDKDKERWIRTNIMRNPFNNDPSKIEMVSVNYDISELKETERNLIDAKNRAEVSDRLKSAFLANMSHEIRTPLNAIVGFSGLLTEAENPEERREYMDIVLENNDLLLKLISDILDLSRIESGSFELHDEPFDANQMCQDIIRSSSIKISGKPVELCLDAPQPEYYMIGDKIRLMQVLSNFINNAVKFTQQGSITLGYQSIGEQVRFYVQDTGSGIPEKELQSIFGRFVKLNTFAQGTGLGLSICKSLIEQMGGQIGVESTEGKGSCFWFTLPLIGSEKK